MTHAPADATAPVVRLRGVRKTYRLGAHVIPALQGVDLEVRRGELLALTGPSGSGKSTILNLCGLIDTPDEGDIALSGTPVQGLDEVARTLLRRDALGFVFQSFNLVPVMTVAENVDYPLFLAGVPLPERRERVARQLAAVGLQDHARHRPDALSGGQRQRVAIARALMHRPPLLLADEPTGNLDPETAARVMDLLIAQTREHGAALVLVTHSNNAAARADRMLRLTANGMRAAPQIPS